ncbi:hypothetical protein B0A50_08686 [Salinomyces thailandicus]|uniref:Uncharacterized protein n=1 Tax=Salinomyces thailandicus TaxID=706561 RepID=A0A4U0TIY8_9PEZI|nr:hypothetical protein B0A50_08686 [Salinomyces thailandica]
MPIEPPSKKRKATAGAKPTHAADETSTTTPERQAGQENEAWQVSLNTTWVEYNPVKAAKAGRGSAQQTVRRHAAAASATARKQTIAARKEAARLSSTQSSEIGSSDTRRSSSSSGVTQSTAVVPRKRGAAGRQRLEDVSDVLHSLGGESLAFPNTDIGALRLLEFMRAFREGREWYADALQGTSLAQNAIRTLLWDSYASNQTLFQAALFISGTHSNSCGLPPTAISHLAPGMLVLRGASLESVQAAILAKDASNESSTPIAIALLAGWERRYGDKQSYEVHMKAWRSLSLPAKALEENNVSTLTEVTLEILRKALDERSSISPSDIKVSSKGPPGPPCGRLLPGFKLFNTARPEVRSLLMLVAVVDVYKIHDLSTLPARRKLGLEILAWSPTHTLRVGPVPSAEESYDELELSALYHTRAALMSINGIIYQKSLDTLGASQLFNVKNALDIHCGSCQHLSTERLLGTKYEELAFWTRFILCAISRNPGRDVMIKGLLDRLELISWEQVRDVLEKYMELDPHFEVGCHELYESLMRLPHHEPTGPGNVQIVSST